MINNICFLKNQNDFHQFVHTAALLNEVASRSRKLQHWYNTVWIRRKRAFVCGDKALPYQDIAITNTWSSRNRTFASHHSPMFFNLHIRKSLLTDSRSRQYTNPLSLGHFSTWLPFVKAIFANRCIKRTPTYQFGHINPIRCNTQE